MHLYYRRRAIHLWAQQLSVAYRCSSPKNQSIRATAFLTIVLGYFSSPTVARPIPGQTAPRLVHEGEANKKFKFFAVGVEGANSDILKQISVGEPIALKGLRFRDLFAWLSSSLSAVSQSNPGDEVKLENPIAPNGWGKIA